jgi:hypothetical protein
LIKAGCKEDLRGEVTGRFQRGKGVITGEEEPDKVGPPVSEVREKYGYRFGIDYLGHGPFRVLGRIVSPGSNFIFILFPSFLFSVFIFLS